MAIEIERKFLVNSAALPAAEKSVRMEQGYLDQERVVVRVRIAGEQAFLTLKGRGEGNARPEFEYPIPVEDARALLRSFALPGRVTKTRFYYRHGKRLWEVDVFDGANEGLVLAEVELESEEAAVEIPPWVECEVSGDPRYFNAYLAGHPFSKWGDGAEKDGCERGGT